MCQLFLCSQQTMLAVALSLGYFLYLFLGAMMFQLLEKQAEENSRDQFQLAKLSFLQNYTCLDVRALEQFVQIIMEAWEKGLNPKGNSTNPSNWDFSSSFFFAGTVITTIGYGNLSPSTVAGQVFCVFYALFGVPLNLAFLNQVGKGLNSYLIALGKCAQRPGESGLMKKLIVAFYLLAGSLLFLVFPPMIFSYVEGWSYGEGFYFAFITLSTIGFGDYVLGTDPNKHYISVYRSLAALWIIFGLAWLALVFNLAAEFVEKLLRFKMQKKHAIKEEKAENHNGENTFAWLLEVTAEYRYRPSNEKKHSKTQNLLKIYSGAHSYLNEEPQIGTDVTFNKDYTSMV
ncbi:potassium channel subfamily K member 16 [Bombina bombina]|uniref:potassium channel subfamily K member 16 n=1 Tax=Bombina bombina TaxID=8345 RepID=UPI00235AD2CB|nr:potassium channel subfamily K member 16 [Bombina bombina]